MSSTPAERFRDLADAIDYALKRGPSSGDATPVPEPLRELLEPLLGTSESAATMSAEAEDQLLHLEPGRTLGEFELVRELGRGGMGIVWEARQLALGRSVALKLLPLAPGVAARTLARFKREGIAGASVQHPGITGVFDVGVQRGIAWIAQELVGTGRTLADRLSELRRAGEVPESHYRDMAVLFECIARALHAAHEAHVIHRDVKPSNVLLTAEGEPKLADFGLAKLLDEPGVSTSGQFAGSPCYASPEQASGEGKAVDGRSDVFSFGTSLYEALVLSRPFDGDTSQQVLLRILHHDPQDPRRLRSRVPAELAAITLKCLEKRRERRYPSALALAEDLERWLRHEPVLARPPGVLSRSWKWARRHPAPTTGLAVFALGFAVALAQLNQNVVALARSEAAEHVAAREAEMQQNASRFLISIFETADPTRNLGTEATAKEILDAAPARARRWYSQDPESLASMLRVLGTIYQNRSEMAQAGELYNEALGLAVQSVGEDTELYFSILNNLAQVEETLGRAEEAQILRDELTQRLERAGDWALPYKLLARLNAAVVGRRERPSETDTELLEIDRLNRSLPEPWDKVHNGVLFNRAQICIETGRNDQALQLLDELLRWQEANLYPDHPDTLRALEAKQVALTNAGRYAEALPLGEDVLGRSRRVLPPPSTGTCTSRWSIRRWSTGYSTARPRLSRCSRRPKRSKRAIPGMSRARGASEP